MLRILSLFLLAGTSVGSGLATAGNSSVSPSVKKSHKAFFGKDYPFDKRPAVDVLHFKHPYPVVQDSDEFDRDFVKDENKDNGEYAAQTEYDRLRHKLAKQKAEVEKASKKKVHAEDELKEAIDREQAHKEKMRREQERKEKAQRAAEKKTGLESSGKKEEKEEKKTRKTYVVPEKTPGGVAQSGDVDVASGETEDAMNKLDDCKKQLEKSREQLKQLTKELDEKKEQQEETQKALDKATEKFKKLETKSEKAQAAAKEEYGEYLDAKDTYLKQQALVAKMEEDLKAAAAKVKALRDGADKDGGVYPTPTKSGGNSHYVAPLLVLGAASLILLQ